MNWGLELSLDVNDEIAEIALVVVNSYCNKHHLKIDEKRYADRDAVKMSYALRPFGEEEEEE